MRVYKEKIEGNKNFTKLAHKGVSLIVLIVTIIVIIILASVIILIINKNNPIESAKEAQFKEDIRTFQNELNLYISKEYTVTSGKRDEKIDALDFDKIKEYIPSFSEKYREKFVIQDDELIYTEKIDEKEKEWLKELNIKGVLPEGCTELEYIESTGTQYIDTLFIPIFGDVITTRAERIGKNAPIFYAGNANQLTILPSEYGYNRGLIYTKYFQGATNAVSFPIKYFDIDGLFHNLYFCKDGLYIDEIKVCKISDNRNDADTSISLFRCNTIFGEVRIANFSLVRDNTILLDLIPVLDKNDVVCMYDKVNKKFYYNQGTGEFIAGPKK